MKRKITTILILTGTICLTILFVSCQRDELYKSNSQAGINGSFEIADAAYPVNWAFFPSPENNEHYNVSLDSTNPYNGKVVLKVAASEISGSTGFRKRIPVKQGKKYKISFAYINKGSEFKVNQILKDASGKVNLQANIILESKKSNSDWKLYENIISIKENEYYLVLIFLMKKPGILFFDDVCIEEIKTK